MTPAIYVNPGPEGSPRRTTRSGYLFSSGQPSFWGLFPEGMSLRLGTAGRPSTAREAQKGSGAEVSSWCLPVRPRPDPFPRRIPLLSAMVARGTGVAGVVAPGSSPATVPRGSMEVSAR